MVSVNQGWHSQKHAWLIESIEAVKVREAAFSVPQHTVYVYGVQNNIEFETAAAPMKNTEAFN